MAFQVADFPGLFRTVVSGAISSYSFICGTVSSVAACMLNIYLYIVPASVVPVVVPALAPFPNSCLDGQLMTPVQVRKMFLEKFGVDVQEDCGLVQCRRMVYRYPGTDQRVVSNRSVKETTEDIALIELTTAVDPKVSARHDFSIMFGALVALTLTQLLISACSGFDACWPCAFMWCFAFPFRSWFISPSALGWAKVRNYIAYGVVCGISIPQDLDSVVGAVALSCGLVHSFLIVLCAPDLPMKSISVVYCPHLATALYMEYSTGTNAVTVASTIRARALRLATLPIPATLMSKIIDGTELAVKTMIDDGNFYEGVNPVFQSAILIPI